MDAELVNTDAVDTDADADADAVNLDAAETEHDEFTLMITDVVQF